MSNYHTLRVVLGDQLNAGHSWYRNKDSGVLYLVAKIRQETDYVQHHVQKVCAFFAAMERFALALKNAGHDVLYLTLDDTVDYPDFRSLINKLCRQYADYLPPQRHVKMEFFYRKLRKRFNLLMEGEQPVGGQYITHRGRKPSPSPGICSARSREIELQWQVVG